MIFLRNRLCLDSVDSVYPWSLSTGCCDGVHLSKIRRGGLRAVGGSPSVFGSRCRKMKIGETDRRRGDF